jgi:hypothetical protein
LLSLWNLALMKMLRCFMLLYRQDLSLTLEMQKAKHLIS